MWEINGKLENEKASSEWSEWGERGAKIKKMKSLTINHLCKMDDL